MKDPTFITRFWLAIHNFTSQAFLFLSFIFREKRCAYTESRIAQTVVWWQCLKQTCRDLFLSELSLNERDSNGEYNNTSLRERDSNGEYNNTVYASQPSYIMPALYPHGSGGIQQRKYDAPTPMGQALVFRENRSPFTRT